MSYFLKYYIDFLLNTLLILPSVWRLKNFFFDCSESPNDFGTNVLLRFSSRASGTTEIVSSFSTTDFSAAPVSFLASFIFSIFDFFFIPVKISLLGVFSSNTRLILHVLFKIGVALPMARGNQRFRLGPASTCKLEI